MMIETGAPPMALMAQGGNNVAQVIDQQLGQLLADLMLLVPCDAAAAWLGHDDRPSLRVVLPQGIDLPPLDSARHLIFQTTTEAARIADLRTYAGLHDIALRSWLGVPLLLDGRRRGWIELLSTQSARFTDHDLHQAAVLVRHAAASIAGYEAVTRAHAEAASAQRAMLGLEQALLAPTIPDTLQHMLATVAADGAVGATLILPSELAYALGVHHDQSPVPVQAQPLADDSLVTVAAQWISPDHAPNIDPVDNLSASDGAVLPCTHAGETLGWIAVQFGSPRPLAATISGLLQQAPTMITALLVWLREHVQREQQAQQSVRMLAQQAHQARAAALTELVAGFAHELNSPVNAVLGISRMIARDPHLPPTVVDHVATLTQSTERISGFVQRLTQFGQATGTAKVPLPLNDVVADTVSVVQGIAEQRGITLTCTLPDESPLVVGNRAQLQQVCLDLLHNAFDALETSDAPAVHIDLMRDDTWAELRISDNGYGIPEDLRERIFMPGYTTKTSGGTRRGLGIGLPMVAEIARQHWGTIGVTSEMWRGSCFTLRLPFI